MSQDKTYIDGVDARTTEIISQYLEARGYRYGYKGRGCERRAAHNMRFITANHDSKMYHGSKGAAVDVDWIELSEMDILDMLRYIKAKALREEYQTKKRYNDLSADDYVMVQEYKDVFGTADYRSMLRNFGAHYDDVTELPYQRKAKCLSMLREQLNLHNARGMLSINGSKSRLSKNQRLVMSKDETRLERVWVTATDREMPISAMKDGHLHNTILLIDRKMRDGNWCIGRNEDLPELLMFMEEERERRGMPMPLVPIKSLEWRKQNV